MAYLKGTGQYGDDLHSISGKRQFAGGCNLVSLHRKIRAFNQRSHRYRARLSEAISNEGRVEILKVNARK